MSYIDSLVINDKLFTYKDIKNKNYSNLSEYELNTLDFCYEWLNGKTEFIINTSGSTGNPKPIKLSRDLMIKSAELTGEFLKLKPKDKILIVLPTQFIAGLMMIVRAFVLELEMYIYNPSSNPLENIKLLDFSLTSFVPLQIYEILKNNPNRLKILESIKNILIGGAPINSNIENAIINLNNNIYHTYGMTETISHIALRKINGSSRSEYFTTLKETKIDLDARNCLTINSPITSYNTIITNDIAELINSFQFKILGRFDNIINSGGVKIQLEKVEKAISNILFDLNINESFFAYGLDDEKLNQKLVLFFESKEFSSRILEKLKYKMNNTLNKYEIPKEIFFLEKFIYTPTNKIDKKKTLSKYS